MDNLKIYKFMLEIDCIFCEEMLNTYGEITEIQENLLSSIATHKDAEKISELKNYIDKIKKLKHKIIDLYFNTKGGGDNANSIT